MNSLTPRIFKAKYNRNFWKRAGVEPKKFSGYWRGLFQRG